MLVKGIIEEKVDNFTYKIRIPFLNKIESDSDPTLSENLSSAPMCTVTGVHVVYQAGDVVFIDFENDDFSDPVIMGRLDRSVDLGSYNSIDTSTLNVDLTATLPDKITIGEIGYPEIVSLKGITGNIQEQINSLSGTSSSTLIWDSKTGISSLGENGAGTAGDYGTGLRGTLQQWFYEMPQKSVRFFYVTFSGTWSPFLSDNMTIIQISKGTSAGLAVFYGKSKLSGTRVKIATIGALNNQWNDFEDVISGVGGSINADLDITGTLTVDGNETLTGRVISSYHGANGSVNGGGAFEIAHGTSNIESMYMARRTDTENALAFGIGTEGVNRGIYDYRLGKWVVLINNNTAAFRGNADTAISATTLSQTLAVKKGGTGETTLNAAANSLINSLTTGASVPEDDDYYVSQYAGGGTTTTIYHRRPISKIWEYIKGKLVSDAGTTRVWTLSAGTAIPENANLNSYSTEGNYTCALTNTAKTLFNGPYGSPTTSGGTTTNTNLSAFIMKVVNSTSGSTYRRQELFEHSTFKHWVRYSGNSGSTWGAWNLYTYKSGDAAVGSSTKPVYISAAGVATATNVDFGWKDVTTQNFSYTLTSSKSGSASDSTYVILNIDNYNVTSYSEVRVVVTINSITKKDYSSSTPGTGTMAVMIGASTSASNIIGKEVGTFTTSSFSSCAYSSPTGTPFYNNDRVNFKVAFVNVSGPLGKDSVISGTIKLQGRNF